METGRSAEAAGGIKAEETIQLPPRDTKKSERLQKQFEDDVKYGRELREKHSSENGEDGRHGSDGDRDGQNDLRPGESHRDRIREKVQHRAGNTESDGGPRGGSA